MSRRAATGRSECVLDVALSNQHGAVIGLLKVNLLAISPKEFRAYSAALRNVRVAEQPRRAELMSANDTAPAPQKCPRCAQYMKLVRRTQRFGGLPDLCTFECAYIGRAPRSWLALFCVRNTASCATPRLHRKIAAALACFRQNRTFWLRLSNGWLKLARDDDKQNG